MCATMDTQPIRFLLNGTKVDVVDIDPHVSLLTWLREHARLTGTKEGCAEGDCGACTVVLGEVDGRGGVRLVPINACIRLLPSVDGKAIFTIEGLTRGDGELHPVQQALADCHGSQCGFCTPGFVMSLFALYKNTPAPTRAKAVEALAGNLCRCTGYRPILDAAAAMQTVSARDAAGATPLASWLDQKAIAPAPARHPGEAAMAEDLKAIARDGDFTYAAGGAIFHAPRTVAAFSRLVLQYPQAWILAGGTDVGLWINKLLLSAGTIIHTGQVAGLGEVVERDGMLDIGAALSLEDAFGALNGHYPEFAHFWQRFASPPIRSSGTLGGNIANGSPIGDAMPLLIALDAQVVLRRGEASRGIALEDLYVDYRKQSRVPGEWVERVLVPMRDPGLTVAAYKNAKRCEQDISAVCMGVALSRDGPTVKRIRIALGGMAGIPKRASAAEASLLGRTWDESAVRGAMRAMEGDFTPLSDMRASGAYRMKVAQNLLLKFLHETAGTDIETRVY